MKKYGNLVLLAFLAGCATFGTNAKTVIWPATLKCAGSVAGPLVTEVLERVQAHDASGLDELAADAGADVVSCVLAQLLNASVTSEARIVRTDGNQDKAFIDAFLSSRGVHH